MITFRISKFRRAADTEGIGAKLVGGRWNNIGTPVIYTSFTRSLSILEFRVHFHEDTIPEKLAITIFELPDEIPVKTVLTTDLSQNWFGFPYDEITQQIGDKFIADAQVPCLKVPSAVVPQEYNLLINPALFEAYKIKILSVEPFDMDGRLMI